MKKLFIFFSPQVSEHNDWWSHLFLKLLAQQIYTSILYTLLKGSLNKKRSQPNNRLWDFFLLFRSDLRGKKNKQKWCWNDILIYLLDSNTRTRRWPHEKPLKLFTPRSRSAEELRGEDKWIKSGNYQPNARCHFSQPKLDHFFSASPPIYFIIKLQNYSRPAVDALTLRSVKGEKYHRSNFPSPAFASEIIVQLKSILSNYCQFSESLKWERNFHANNLNKEIFRFLVVDVSKYN